MGTSQARLQSFTVDITYDLGRFAHIILSHAQIGKWRIARHQDLLNLMLHLYVLSTTYALEGPEVTGR